MSPGADSARGQLQLPAGLPIQSARRLHWVGLGYVFPRETSVDRCRSIRKGGIAREYIGKAHGR